MDGQIPPIQTGLNPTAPMGYQIPAPPPISPGMAIPGGNRSPGRPNADPEAQELRDTRNLEKKRLGKILPLEMTDGKIAIYAMEGKARGRTPVISIMFRDLEAASQEGKDPGEFIRSKIIDKFGEKGRYIWVAQDHRGRQMPDYAEVEVNFDNSDTIDSSDPFADEITIPTRRGRINGPRMFDSHDDQPPVPPTPAFNPATHARELQDVMKDERKAGGDSMMLLMTMMTNQNNLAAQMAEQRRIEDERRRKDEEDRREREEQREEQRREREEQRRKDEAKMEAERAERMEARRREEAVQQQQMMMQQQQMMLQMMTTMNSRPDTTTPLLMKMIDGKNDREGTKEIFGLMTEASRQAMVSQGEATKSLLSAQADASKAIIANVMNISETVMKASLEAQNNDDGDSNPMAKFGQIMEVMKPVLGVLNAGQTPTMPALPPAHQPQQPQQAQRPSDNNFIQGSLLTIMRLETGEIQASQRTEALTWVANNLPESMKQAIRSGEQNQIMAVGMPAMNDVLTAWIQKEDRGDFLMEAIGDVQKMLLQSWDQSAVNESNAKHAAYRKKHPLVSAQTTSPAAPTATTARRRPAPPPPPDQPMAEAEKKEAPPAQVSPPAPFVPTTDEKK